MTSSTGSSTWAANLLRPGTTPSIVDELSPPPDPLPSACREAQNALRAASNSADNAIQNGYVINRLLKAAENKAPQGSWPGQALDNLRSAILFAGAGADRAVKVLAKDALPTLLQHDVEVQQRLASFATRAITARDRSVDPVALVELFLSSGETPREILANQWIADLTTSSAQSSDRMHALAQALGITYGPLLCRVRPAADRQNPTKLQQAFRERNQVAHELDITSPTADLRQPLEKIKRGRSPKPVRENCFEMLEVTQLIINDVASRLAS